MTAKGLLRRAEEVRVREHRLKPSLRLRTKEDIVGFLHDKELVSFLGGNELPSLISAVLGRPWKPSKKGFSGWFDWWSVKISGQPMAQVSREIESRDDILATRVFRRTKTLVSNKIWPTLDPIVKHHRDLVRKGKLFTELERRLLRAIEENPIRTDRLRKTLKLDAKQNNLRFHRALTNLESFSLIIGFEDPHPERHLHANIWQTWETRTTKSIRDVGLSYEQALSDLLDKTIRASVYAPKDQIIKWFPWGSDMAVSEKELLGQERILRKGSFLVSPIAIHQ